MNVFQPSTILSVFPLFKLSIKPKQGQVVTIRTNIFICCITWKFSFKITVNLRLIQVSPGGAQGRLHWLLRSCHASACLPVTLRCPPPSLPTSTTLSHTCTCSTKMAPPPPVYVLGQEHLLWHCTYYSDPSYLSCVPMSPQKLLCRTVEVVAQRIRGWQRTKIWSSSTMALCREGETYQRFDHLGLPSSSPSILGTSLHSSGFSFHQRRAGTHVLSALRHWSKCKRESFYLKGSSVGLVTVVIEVFMIFILSGNPLRLWKMCLTIGLYPSLFVFGTSVRV